MNKSTQRKSVMVQRNKKPLQAVRQPRNHIGEYLIVFGFGYISSLIIPIRVVTSEVYCPNQSCPSSQHIILRGGNHD